MALMGPMVNLAKKAPQADLVLMEQMVNQVLEVCLSFAYCLHLIYIVVTS